MSYLVLHAYPIWDTLVTLKKYVSIQSPQSPSQSPEPLLSQPVNDSDNVGEKTELITENDVNDKMSHWLTFWVLSFGINNLPLPDVAQWILTSLLFMPSSTTKARNILIDYMPTIQENTQNLFTKLKVQLSKHALQTMANNNQANVRTAATPSEI